MGEERRHEVCATHNNKHGFRGVEWHTAKGKFAARIEATPGKRGKWLGWSATVEEAARAYDRAARVAYGDVARLNFPDVGELPTQPSRRAEGLCPKGHDLAEHGYVRPDGRSTTCRACNKEAARRSYRKRTSAPFNPETPP